MPTGDLHTSTTRFHVLGNDGYYYGQDFPLASSAYASVEHYTELASTPTKTYPNALLKALPFVVVEVTDTHSEKVLAPLQETRYGPTP